VGPFSLYVGFRLPLFSVSSSVQIFFFYSTVVWKFLKLLGEFIKAPVFYKIVCMNMVLSLAIGFVLIVENSIFLSADIQKYINKHSLHHIFWLCVLW
jgi:hypothetical protein